MSEDQPFKFDVIIGNPPYQEETIGDNKGFAPPIYHKFLESAYEIGDIVEMIHPGRFLFNAGSTPKAWNKKMLNDEHLKVLFYEQDSSKVFQNTDIKGGVAVTYHDLNQEFDSISVFTPFEELHNIMQKVGLREDFQSFSGIIYAPENYKFTDKMHEDYPTAESRLSKGHKYDLKSNVFDKLDDIFLDDVPKNEVQNDYIKIYGLKNKKRVFQFIKKEYIRNNTNLMSWKVFVPKANGSGAIGEVLSTPLIGEPLIGEPLIGNTQTFISIGDFSTEYEASATLKYIKGKFCRALLGILKITQDNTQSRWACVPLQDFTPESDIDWTKSIPEIDQQLYKKYGLSKDEIDFIETHVKEMN